MKLFRILISVVLSFSTALIGLGYAQLDSKISSQGTVLGAMQTGVFISAVSEEQGVTINTYYSTILDSEVFLANDNDAKTLTISLYNNSTDEYAFKNVVYDSGIAGAYSNSNITFTCSLQPNQKIEPQQSLEFTIAFTFREDYTATTSESLQSILNFYFGLWEGSEILPDDVVGFNHKVLIENIVNGTMTDSNGNLVEIGLNNPDSQLSEQINDRISKRKYTFGSMDFYDSEEMHAIFGLEAANLTFLVYSPENDTNVKYLYTTSCDLGESGLLWWGNAKYPTGERVYPIYRTRLEYQEKVDEKGEKVQEWVAVKTILGSAKSAYYDNDAFGSAISKNPAFDPTTFAPCKAEDCESGETAIDMGSSVSTAIYIPLGTTVDEVANSTDKTYFKYQSLSNGTVTISPTDKSELLTISVYSDASLESLIVSETGKDVSFNASEITYYIVATGDSEINFTIK